MRNFALPSFKPVVNQHRFAYEEVSWRDVLPSLGNENLQRRRAFGGTDEERIYEEQNDHLAVVMEGPLKSAKSTEGEEAKEEVRNGPTITETNKQQSNDQQNDRLAIVRKESLLSPKSIDGEEVEEKKQAGKEAEKEAEKEAKEKAKEVRQEPTIMKTNEQQIHDRQNDRLATGRKEALPPINTMNGKGVKEGVRNWPTIAVTSKQQIHEKRNDRLPVAWKEPRRSVQSKGKNREEIEEIIRSWPATMGPTERRWRLLSLGYPLDTRPGNQIGEEVPAKR